MRTIVVLLYTLIMMIVSLPFLLIAFLLRLINQKAAARMALQFMRISFKAYLFVAGAKKTIIGRESIPRNRPILYAANHRGFYDVLLAYSEVPTQTIFIAKKELKSFIVIAQWMHILNCLFIDRDDMKQQMNVIKAATDYAKDGYSVYIAPEGTRNTSEELLPFKEGSFRIARKADCPIVPVCIIGTEALFEDAVPWLRKGRILIEFGEPIFLDQLDKEQQKHIGAYVQNIVAKMYEKNKLLLKGEKV